MGVLTKTGSQQGSSKYWQDATSTTSHRMVGALRQDWDPINSLTARLCQSEDLIYPHLVGSTIVLILYSIQIAMILTFWEKHLDLMKIVNVTSI